MLIAIAIAITIVMKGRERPPPTVARQKNIRLPSLTSAHFFARY